MAGEVSVLGFIVAWDMAMVATRIFGTPTVIHGEMDIMVGIMDPIIPDKFLSSTTEILEEHGFLIPKEVQEAPISTILLTTQDPVL